MAFNYWILVGVAAVVAIYLVFNKVRSKKSDLESKNKPAGPMNAINASMAEFFVPIDKYPKDIAGISPKTLGGQPLFYNEVDHTKGRFLGWVRNDADKADVRKMQNGFYRARIHMDVMRFWFIRSHKEILTPCVFRPGIDAITKGPGEEEGVPPEGLVIFKRSLAGTELANSTSERYRNQLLDEKFKNGVMADMLITVRDKERYQGLGDASKELTDEMENNLKRTKKVHDAIQNRPSGLGYGAPYGSEMYGAENPDLGLGNESNLWKFEG